MSITDPVPEREKGSSELGSKIDPNLLSKKNDKKEGNIQVSIQTDELASFLNNVESATIYGDDVHPETADMDEEYGSQTMLRPDSEIHDRTNKLESRVSMLEELDQVYHPNSSFQTAVKDSLISGGLLKDPEVRSELHQTSIRWTDFSPKTQDRIKTSSVEPLHDIIVLLGLTVSILSMIGAFLVGFHLLAIIFFAMAGFLYYSYKTGIGE
jgi:hypothetical protein